MRSRVWGWRRRRGAPVGPSLYPGIHQVYPLTSSSPVPMRLAVLTTTRVRSLLACSSAPGYTHFAHGVEYEGPGYQEADLPYQRNLAEASRPPRPTIQEDQHMSS